MTQAWLWPFGGLPLKKHSGVTAARLTTQTTVPSSESICLGGIFCWGEVDPGLCGLLLCAVTHGYQEKGAE